MKKYIKLAYKQIFGKKTSAYVKAEVVGNKL